MRGRFDNGLRSALHGHNKEKAAVKVGVRSALLCLSVSSVRLLMAQVLTFTPSTTATYDMMPNKRSNRLQRDHRQQV
ncbi:hypothetical protein JOB18_043950 [Solea senegalensis]|uniref:Uncharacterized protein n=1 Tax=Solea senegalensis TaxID=28829 RepID=A0AAV6PVM9_SOLSE|nr:hypothetical protein JOB18_043950 [Solea senegalensis]